MEPILSHLTVEDCIRLDVRDLRRRGYLFPGWSALWSWSSGPSIRIEVQAHAIVLSYSSQGEDVRYSVGLTRTACHYGSDRAWFLCPATRCGRRCAVLYNADRYFACRRCNGLAYRTQQEKPDGRALIKAERIWRRAGCAFGGDEGEKPKGMHWRTFDRLMAAAEEAYAASWNCGRVARLLSRAGVG